MVGGRKLLEVVPIFLDVVPPLGGHRKLVENSVYRADRHTIGAINAGFRIDVKHIVIVGGDDAIDGADLDAGSVFDTFAGFG